MNPTYIIDGIILYAEPYTTKAQKHGHLIGIRTEDGTTIQLYTTQTTPPPGTPVKATGTITQHVNNGGYMQTTLRDARILTQQDIITDQTQLDHQQETQSEIDTINNELNQLQETTPETPAT